LVLVIEGIFLFALPGLWQRAAAQLITAPKQQLRIMGAVLMAAGLLALWLVRGF